MGAIPWGFSFAQKGVLVYGLPQGWLPGTGMVHPQVQAGPTVPQEVNPCQRNPNDHVLTPAVPNLLMDSTARITLLLPAGSTTNTSVPRTSTRSTVVPGNASETDTSVSILSARSARSKADLFLQRKYITKSPFRRVALMQGTISCPCADPVTIRSTMKLVTGRGVRISGT